MTPYQFELFLAYNITGPSYRFSKVLYYNMSMRYHLASVLF